MKSVLLVSHGSRSAQTKVEVEALVNRLKKLNVAAIIHYAFLELETPSIPQGIDLCVQKGVSEIIILLNFLNSGKHVNEDIPTFIKQAQQKYPAVKFQITAPVGQHPGIDALFVDLIQ